MYKWYGPHPLAKNTFTPCTASASLAEADVGAAAAAAAGAAGAAGAAATAAGTGAEGGAATGWVAAA